MGKSRAELNMAADERARQAGFTSRSQQYRARKVGYGQKPAEYNAVIEQRYAKAIVKRAAKGLLLGGKMMRVGTVISADLSKGQGPELWRQLQRYRPDKRVRVVIETSEGRVIEVGGKGGMRLSYLRAMHAETAGKPSKPFTDTGRERDRAQIITVTLV